jgi:signal transduction histidine kinase
MPEFTALAGDFDEMAARIESLVNAPRQLLRDVSHKLRTPLTRLGLAVDNARAARPGEIDVCWNRIDQETQRLNELIERILRLSRLELLRTSEHCAPIAL